MSKSLFHTDNESNEPKSYPTLSLPDLLDGPTEVDWLVEPFIPPGAAVLLAGRSGVGKTWLALDMALSVATGEDWLRQFPVRRGPVLLIDEENSELLLRVRLKMLLEARGISGGDLPLHFLVSAGVNLSPIRTKSGVLKPTSSYKRLTATVEEIKPELVVFDSLTRVHRANENSSNEMSAVFDNVKRLMNHTGCSCLLVHHFRKGGASKSRSGDQIRGSGDIRAFQDTTLLVADREGGCKVIHDKPRWSKAVKPFGVDLTHHDDDSFSVTYAGEMEADDGKTLLVQVWEYVKGEIEQHGPCYRQQLIANLNGLCSDRYLDKVLKWRVEHDFLTKEGDGREKVFDLGDIDDTPMEVDNSKSFSPPGSGQ